MASTLRPITLVFRFSKSGLSFATVPSSVVHTGVKSRGCENRTAQFLPFQSWKLIRPSVVSALKSGASSPNRIAMANLLCGTDRRPAAGAGQLMGAGGLLRFFLGAYTGASPTRKGMGFE